MLEERRRKAEQGNWFPASGGTETPFTTRTGHKLLYVWQPSTGRHAYLDMGTDMILTDEESRGVLGTNPTKGPLHVEAGGPRARYFRVRLADPRGFRARLPQSGGRFRTITLSSRKGIKAIIGAMATRGPRGGRTDLQALLFEKTKWSPRQALTEAKKIGRGKAISRGAKKTA